MNGLGDLSMDASVNTREPWSPEVAARLRGAMIAFVAVLLLSMVTTIGYIAGRTFPASHSRDQVMRENFRHAAPASLSPLQLSSPRPAEPPMPVPVPRQPALAMKEQPIKPAPEPATDTPSKTDADSRTLIPVPQSGEYLQVGAVDLTAAQQMVRTLQNNGFAAVIAPGPSDTIFRVVVGPFPSPEAAAQATTALVSKGYQSFPRRY